MPVSTRSLIASEEMQGIVDLFTRERRPHYSRTTALQPRLAHAATRSVAERLDEWARWGA